MSKYYVFDKDDFTDEEMKKILQDKDTAKVIDNYSFISKNESYVNDDNEDIFAAYDGLYDYIENAYDWDGFVRPSTTYEYFEIGIDVALDLMKSDFEEDESMSDRIFNSEDSGKEIYKIRYEYIARGFEKEKQNIIKDIDNAIDRLNNGDRSVIN